jgi:hypothetical protein
METLLSLTSKRAGEWFKEELRELGGVDHLIRTVTSSVRRLVSSKVLLGLNSWDSNMAETFSKIERCLKVLENVSKLMFIFLSFVMCGVLCLSVR